MIGSSPIRSTKRWTHRDALGGVKYGFGWYIPSENRAIAEQIVQVFCDEEKYGTSWMNPPLPAMTCLQMARGIANGLLDEVDAQFAKLEKRRREVRVRRGGFNAQGAAVAISDELPSEAFAYTAKGERLDIGTTAAETFAIRFARVSKRIAKYADTLGPALLAECNARIGDALIELDALLEGGAFTTGGAPRDFEAEAAARAEAARQAALPEESFALVGAA